MLVKSIRAALIKLFFNTEFFLMHRTNFRIVSSLEKVWRERESKPGPFVPELTLLTTRAPLRPSSAKSKLFLLRK